MRTRSREPDALAYLRPVGLATVAAWPTVQALDRRATAGVVVEEAKA